MQIICPHCGLVQSMSVGSYSDIVYCRRCRSQLERRAGRSLDAALACAAATLMFLIPATFEPFLTTAAFGVTRTSVLPYSALYLWQEGWPFLSIVIALFVIVFPAIRFGALTAVLLALRVGARPRWASGALRIADALATWAMLDVFLLGSAVALERLHATIGVTVQLGGLCFAAAAVLSLFVRATLDERAVWRSIGSDYPRIPAKARPESASRSLALLAAAAILYVPANVYPIATIPVGFTPTPYTVFGGIVDLARSHLWALAALVFCLSFAIPVLKIVALFWCAMSAIRGSNERLITKTRVYRTIEEIGRWSMIDPFTISCFVPVLHFNNLIDARADAAATPFAAVAILTTLAVKLFDPRWMWAATDARGGTR